VPRLFVYGTLKRSAPNHHVLARAGARFERHATTEPAYDLVDLGPYPAMLDGGPLAVHGEVWAVDDVAALDRFEGAPDLYRRTAVRLDDGTLAEAYVWARELPRGARRIPSGAYG